MEITANLVKELREKTGAGMMDCKKALSEAQGDFEKAVEYLRKKGLAAAAKKTSRMASDGAVVAVSDQAGDYSLLLEVNCETDFVARNEGFQNFVNDLAAHILSARPENLAMLLNQPFVKNPEITISQLLTEVIGKIGENIVVRRFVLYQKSSQSIIENYIHGGGKIGVLIEIGTEKEDLAKNESLRTFAKDLAMQVAAAAPQVVRPDEVPAELINKEKEIFLALMSQDPKNANKPQNVLEKIIEGKIKKFTDEISLVNQAFVKNPSLTISQYLLETQKKVGGTLSIKRFSRFQLGEGLKATETTH